MLVLYFIVSEKIRHAGNNTIYVEIIIQCEAMHFRHCGKKKNDICDNFDEIMSHVCCVCVCLFVCAWYTSFDSLESQRIQETIRSRTNKTTSNCQNPSSSILSRQSTKWTLSQGSCREMLKISYLFYKFKKGRSLNVIFSFFFLSFSLSVSLSLSIYLYHLSLCLLSYLSRVYLFFSFSS